MICLVSILGTVGCFCNRSVAARSSVAIRSRMFWGISAGLKEMLRESGRGMSSGQKRNCEGLRCVSLEFVSSRFARVTKSWRASLLVIGVLVLEWPATAFATRCLWDGVGAPIALARSSSAWRVFFSCLEVSFARSRRVLLVLPIASWLYVAKLATVIGFLLRSRKKRWEYA